MQLALASGGDVILDAKPFEASDERGSVLSYNQHYGRSLCKRCWIEKNSRAALPSTGVRYVRVNQAMLDSFSQRLLCMIETMEALPKCVTLNVWGA